MSDIVFETIRAVILLYLLIYLIREGKKRSELCRKGWSFIIAGFGLLLFANIMDITDNFESLNRFVIIGDTAGQAFLEKMVGFMGGFLVLAVGLIRWIPTISNLGEAEQLNKKLEMEIAERKQTQAALSNSDAKYRILYESSEDAIMLLNPKTCVFVGGNPSTIRIFGAKDEKAFIEIGPAQVSPKYQRDGQLSSEKAVEMMSKAMNEGSHFFEWVHKRLDGTEFPATVLLTYVQFQSEIFLQAVVRDISKEKEAQERLEESNQELDAQQQQLLALNQQLKVEVASRRQAQDALERSKAFLNSTGQMAKVGGWELELNPLKLSWTAGTRVIHGLPLDYVPVLDEANNFYHPDDKPRIQEAIRRSIEHGESFDLELRVITAKGRGIWVQVIGKPLIIDGKTVKVSGTFQDITERKQVQDALTASENRFRDIAESMSDWIWEVDINGVYTHCSGNVESILGYQANEVIDKTPFDFMLPEEADRVGSIFGDIVKDKKPIRNLENWKLTKDGRKICFLTSGVPILGDAGEFLGYRGVDSDITEVKLAEDKMNAIFNSIPVGMMLANEQLEIVELNNKVANITGREVDQLIGLQPGDILFCKNAINGNGGCGKGDGCADCVVRAGLKKILRVFQPVENTEVQMELLVGGEIITPWLSISVVPTEINQKKHLVIAFLDVTERKEADKKLQETLSEIERFNRLMTGRESRVVEMKKEVNALLAELGRDSQYESVLNSPEDKIISMGDSL